MSKKRCPYCGNLIQEKAKRCKYCKVYLAEPVSSSVRIKKDSFIKKCKNKMFFKKEKS